MPIRRTLRRPVVLAAAALFSAGCGDDSAAPAAAAMTRLESVPSGAAFAALDYRAGDLFAMDARGRLLLSDADAGQVIFYGADGTEERRLGRKGAGPGEHMLPNGAAVGPDGSLVVLDAALLRLSHFDAQHRLVSTQPVPGMPLKLLRWDGRQALLVWVGGGDAGPVVGSIDVSTGKAQALYRPYERAPELAATPAMIPGVGTQPWVASAFAPDGRVLMARGEAYRVFALDPATGAVRTSFGRPDVERELPSEREAAAMEEKMTRMFKNTGMAPEDYAPFVQQVRGQRKPFFLMNSFAADADGRLWIATERGAYGETQLDLFDSAGAFVRTLVVRDRVRRIAVSLPYLAVLVERQSGPAEGAEGVDLYRVDALP